MSPSKSLCSNMRRLNGHLLGVDADVMRLSIIQSVKGRSDLTLPCAYDASADIQKMETELVKTVPCSEVQSVSLQSLQRRLLDPIADLGILRSNIVDPKDQRTENDFLALSQRCKDFIYKSGQSRGATNDAGRACLPASCAIDGPPEVRSNSVERPVSVPACALVPPLCGSSVRSVGSESRRGVAVAMSPPVLQGDHNGDMWTDTIEKHEQHFESRPVENTGQGSPCPVNYSEAPIGSPAEILHTECSSPPLERISVPSRQVEVMQNTEQRIDGRIEVVSEEPLRMLRRSDFIRRLVHVKRARSRLSPRNRENPLHSDLSLKSSGEREDDSVSLSKDLPPAANVETRSYISPGSLVTVCHFGVQIRGVVEARYPQTVLVRFSDGSFSEIDCNQIT